MTRLRTTTISALCATLAASVPLAAHASPIAAVASPGRAELHATVSFAALARGDANRQALAHQALRTPAHRMPDGSFTTDRRPLPSLARLPVSQAVSGIVPAAVKAVGGTGIYEGSNATANGYELEPPDQGFAVANSIAGEVVNNTIEFFSTKTGKALSTPLATSTFFNLDPTIYQTITDPHVTYDPSTSRWFVNEEASNSSTGENDIVVAVSTTSNPLGTYYVYLVNAFSSDIKKCRGNCFPDYPQVGFDANAFFVTTDLFSPTTFIEAGVYVLPKALLETGASFTYVRFGFNDFVVQPSIPAPGEPFVTAQNGTEYLMSARNILDGTSNIDVYAVSNTAAIATAPTTLTATATVVAAETYTSSVPSTQPNVVGPYGQSVGATSAPQLDGGYNAFGSTIKMAGGKLYAALTSGAADANGLARDVIAWFAVAPTVSATGLTASVSGQGYVVPGSGYSISYPSFALSSAGSGVLGFSITNPSASVAGGYPSAGFTQFASLAAGSTITVVGKGATSDDGFTGYNGAGPGVVGRWGDYSAGAVDSVTGYYYLANEYIPNPVKFPRGQYANWGTFLSEIH